VSPGVGELGVRAIDAGLKSEVAKSDAGQKSEVGESEIASKNRMVLSNEDLVWSTKYHEGRFCC
jgi:hypothetical protein